MPGNLHEVRKNLPSGGFCVSKTPPLLGTSIIMYTKIKFMHTYSIAA